MIIEIISEKNSNLFDNVLNNYIHTKYSGKYDLNKMLKQMINGSEDIDYILVDTSACKNTFQEIINAIKYYQNIIRDITFIIYTDIENKKFVLKLIENNIFNIVTSKNFDKARKELQLCLDGFMTESYVNELLGISLIKPNKIEFKDKTRSIGVVGPMERVGTTTLAINLASFISSCNGKVLYIDVQGDTVKYIAQEYNIKEDSGIYKYSNILHLQERGIQNSNRYNCYVYDFGVVSDMLIQALNEMDIIVLVTTNKLYEMELINKAKDFFNNNNLSYNKITNLTQEEGGVSFIKDAFDGEYRYDVYKNLFLGGGKNAIKK